MTQAPARGRHAAWRARARTVVPEPALEHARLLLARRLEARVRRSSATRGAALVFHAVAPHGGDETLEIDPALAVDRLEAAVAHLSRHYALVPAAALPAAARARRPGERVPVAVTFDDDLPSHRDHAAPVMRRHGVVATAFVCGAREPFWWQLLQLAVDGRQIAAETLPHVDADLVGRALARRPRAIHHLAKAVEDLVPAQRERVTAVLARTVRERPPLLGAEGVAALAAAGWEIGFHTRRHDVLTTLDDSALREALEPAASTGARTLAYPHGKATEREARAARDAGYVAAYTGRAEVLSERTDDHLIGRLQPDSATLGRFALHLARALSVP